MNQYGFVCWLFLASLAALTLADAPVRAGGLQAGAASVDISPRTLPAIRNGGFLQAEWNRVDDPLHARCLVLSDGKETIAMAIVDSCMLPTEICEAIKAKVADEISLPTQRILISATHTHSAPSVMSYCLGSGRDEAYVEFVVPQIAQAIVSAHRNLRPAKLGWTSVDAEEHTNCRRWITRSDRIRTDPFGEPTVRAMMHPGYLNPDYVSPAGPVDHQLSVLSVVSAQDDSPICVLANYSMHYFGSSSGFSADYFGEVADLLESQIAQTDDASDHTFVGIMSQGTSGDLHWMNYAKPQQRVDRKDYAQKIAEKTLVAWKQIEHRSDLTIAMAESRMKLRRRGPDAQRQAWAKTLNEQRGERPPKDRPEVYAQQAQWIDENPETEVVLQAVRIGDLGITALPNEVYGITGLKLKQQSPLGDTFNLELANGAEGYIPPPEQHRLGGYTTWPARTAGLEIDAEPKIVDRVLSLLESVSKKKRRPLVDPPNAYSRAILSAEPAAYWRLGDMVVDRATDATGNHHATFQGGVALYLPGPSGGGFDETGNRSVYFAGGSLEATVNSLPNPYSVSMWFWNGLPADGHRQSGTLFSRGRDESIESLSIISDDRGMTLLAFDDGSTQHVAATPLSNQAWHHVTWVRDDESVKVFLDGNSKPELELQHPAKDSSRAEEFSFGRFDGKLDDIALFARTLSADERSGLYRTSGMQPPARPRRPFIQSEKPSNDDSLKRYAEVVRTSQPLAYWRLHDADRHSARDEMGGNHARYEPNAGPRKPGTATPNFSGGRVLAEVSKLDEDYSVEFWFRNELPITNRPITAYLFTRGVDGANGAPGDNLGLGGTHTSTGRLLVFNGNERGESVTGKTLLVPGGWHHVVMTRQGANVKVFLNGEIEIDDRLPKTYPDGCGEFQIGGRNDNFANLEGMIDEVAVYDRAITSEEAKSHFVAAGVPSTPVENTTTNAQQESEPTPTAAADSLEKIHVREGYRIQLVASEPQLKDPVAIDWGRDGKLWVVEMADYPLGIDGQGKPGGRIRVLEDRDADGYYETSTLFADQLSFPNGILVWGNGVLITAAPEILYLEDSNGDGKADVKRTVFNGFLEGNQQLRVNGLRWGLDNWVHCASGSHHAGYGKGNQISSVITGESHQIGSRDFRIRPDSGEIDPQSGPSQYGRNRDDWGNWFGVQNSRPLWHYVLADEDIRRNPHFAPPDPKHLVVTPVNPPVFPAAQLQKRFHSFNQSGRFTSACSAMIYRDDVLFPQTDDEQHAFTCEPFHNLVQHNIITEDGVSFDFHRDPAEDAVDFFASEDRWCRPVMVRTGPDGALWVVDMYRYMIEHPQWLPQNGKDELRPYYRLGENQGRIYRVLPSGKNPAIPKIDDSSEGLLRALASSNGWQRDVAQRTLVRTKDTTAVPHLRSMAIADDRPRQRLQALCTLDGMQALNAEVLQTALHDPHPAVRRQAVRLAASHLVEVQTLASLVDDEDAKVRLQLAATLGTYEDPLASQALASLAWQSADDAYIVANVMSSLSDRNLTDVLNAFMTIASDSAARHRSDHPLQQQLFAQVAAMGDADAIGQTVASLAGRSDLPPEPWQLSGLAELLDGLGKRKFSVTQLSDAQQQLIAGSIQQARSVVSEASGKLPPSVDSALRLLLRQPDVYPHDMRLLAELLVPQSTVELQLAVVDRLANESDPQIGQVLLSGWPSYGPALRSRVLDVLSGRAAWSSALLAAVRAGKLSSGEIGPAIRERLLATKDKTLQSGWTEAFASSTSPDRRKVIDDYQNALTLAGDLERGKKVFAKSCAACHRLGNVGHEVGPNLASITDKRPHVLLSNILDPSAAVEARYLTYIVLSDDGRVRNGLLGTETGSSITLLSGEGKRETILRSEIEELRASGKSLMPDGLEKELSPQDVADLIALLRSDPTSAD
ncbi:neutral/alkaline non-lysosomal ceramidase N-terminal domain-containing protein [Stieleria sp. ICT_E10.1]|uniref:neutral/alkaline non-lysosomal ceramidase N-terminal domain-containing protein n=1 Tax=Stieleria sedimenti TaxID=2976331 RepID=UPI00217F6267|nr:neutral/alkaline non-lysosomal ceramidase N-terminal domain-containing protein [Stieleria sedimenti]MCS7468440.1 neutral/alkaline non-lysosomal ceramidase N-terminal domain-containing protein [Stieleria sedimenti]